MRRTLCAAVVAFVATVSPLAAQPSPLAQLGIEQSKSWRVETDMVSGTWRLQGDVEVKVGTATLYADEAEYSKSRNELKLHGNVRVQVTPLPVIEATTVKRLATGVVEYRWKVRVALDTNGTEVLADGADYRDATNELVLLGDGLLRKTPVPAQKR